MHAPTHRPADLPRDLAPQPPSAPRTPWLARCAAATLLLVQLAPQALAESVVVTRKTADIYGVKGDDVLLLTINCEIYALASAARLQPESGRMVLRFDDATVAQDRSSATPVAGSSTPRGNGTGMGTGTGTRCDLRDMVKPQQIPRGRYHVKLSFESADWYAIDGTSLLLRTLGCQRQSAGEPVVWFQPMEGKGVIEYRSGNPCTSDGVFGSLRRKARAQPAR